jgi:hypothetical protein
MASLSSGILLVGGLGAMCLDYAVTGGIAQIDDHFALALCANFLGIIFCLVSLSGWAKHSGRQSRIKIGAMTFLVSVGTGVLGSIIRPIDVHGPFSMLFLTLVPTSVLGLVLWLNAVRTRS